MLKSKADKARRLVPKSIMKLDKIDKSIDINKSADSDQNLSQTMRILVEVKRPTKKHAILRANKRNMMSSVTDTIEYTKTLFNISPKLHQTTKIKNKNSKMKVSDLQSRQKIFIRNLLEKFDLSPSSSELTNTFKPAFMS